MYWSTEDTLKLLGLTLFVGAFVAVIRQLLQAEARLSAKEVQKKE